MDALWVPCPRSLRGPNPRIFQLSNWVLLTVHSSLLSRGLPLIDKELPCLESHPQDDGIRPSLDFPRGWFFPISSLSLQPSPTFSLLLFFFPVSESVAPKSSCQVLLLSNPTKGSPYFQQFLTHMSPFYFLWFANSNLRQAESPLKSQRSYFFQRDPALSQGLNASTVGSHVSILYSHIQKSEVTVYVQWLS